MGLILQTFSIIFGKYSEFARLTVLNTIVLNLRACIHLPTEIGLQPKTIKYHVQRVWHAKWEHPVCLSLLSLNFAIDMAPLSCQLLRIPLSPCCPGNLSHMCRLSAVFQPRAEHRMAMREEPRIISKNSHWILSSICGVKTSGYCYLILTLVHFSVIHLNPWPAFFFPHCLCATSMLSSIISMVPDTFTPCICSVGSWQLIFWCSSDIWIWPPSASAVQDSTRTSRTEVILDWSENNVFCCCT